MKKIYRILLACNSIIIFFVVYLIKSHVMIPVLKYEWLSYFLYIVCTVVFSRICLLLARFLPDEILNGGIKEAELADGSYLPSYLGYFFVALSISDISTMMWIGGIIFVFISFSQTLYFNPMFLLFGYRFYYLTMDNGMKLFVLTKVPIKKVKELHFDRLKRINEYTFIDRRSKNELRDC